MKRTDTVLLSQRVALVNDLWRYSYVSKFMLLLLLLLLFLGISHQLLLHIYCQKVILSE